MFGSVALTVHSAEDYIPIAGRDAIETLRDLARPLEGARILNLSSPRASGAVRGLLQSKIPLLVDLGLQAYWQQVRVPVECLEVDRQLRRALSGYPADWSPELEASWWDLNVANAHFFDEDFDIVIVHHTGSVGLYAAVRELRGADPAGVWIWDSHRDYRAALPEAWALIQRYADDFAVSIYDYALFIREDAPTRNRVVIPPGIDPLGPKSRRVSSDVREMVLAHRGIDLRHPLIAQIILNIRQDDPARIFQTFELVRRHKPDVQLVIANLLRNGPDLAEQVEELRARGRELGGVVVVAEMDRVGNVELAALRDQAAVLIHQGFPRGISLELLEEMWQGRPIVSGRSSMAEAVLENNQTALLADTPEEQAKAILWLLDHPAEAKELARKARDVVASRYLISHELAAELRLFQDLLGRGNTQKTSAPRRTKP